MTHFSTEHNHEVSEAIYKNYPEVSQPYPRDKKKSLLLHKQSVILAQKDALKVMKSTSESSS